MVVRGRAEASAAASSSAVDETSFELIGTAEERAEAGWARIVQAAITLKRVRGYWHELGQYLQWVKKRGKDGGDRASAATVQAASSRRGSSTITSDVRVTATVTTTSRSRGSGGYGRR